jgi:hypothetical protein
MRNLRSSSTFNGNFLGRDRVEITAEYQPQRVDSP